MVTSEIRGWQRWGTNHASRWIFLLNHSSRRFFSPITRNVKRSKYIANFTFLTLKASLKEKLCRFKHKNASANMWPLTRKRSSRYPFERLKTHGNWTSLRTGGKKSGAGGENKIRRAKRAVDGPLTDLFEPLLGKIYSHITSSFLVTSELFHVF